MRRLFALATSGLVLLPLGTRPGDLPERPQTLFLLPTANHSLFEPDGTDKFFAPTPGKAATSGAFGCVRSEGRQFHEGIDIRSLERDRRGEPIDPVLATADGRIVYVNRKAGLSNYGIYLIVRHQVQGLELHSLYAHLRSVEPGVKPGFMVRAGQKIATLGRTSNTGAGIGRDRAHLHFELSLLLNERFPEWYRRNCPGQRNDHDRWNGQNFLGIDPLLVFLGQREHGTNFHLPTLLRQQPVLARVFVRGSDFSWLDRNPALVDPEPSAAAEPPAGYELHLLYTGVPVRALPRTAAEIPAASRFALIEVNEAEQRRNPCRELVVQRHGRWQLAENGRRLLGLLTY